eukprot:GHVP01014708.1.p1 GENE.GHVP01014708.1~~GHVP01014708.1.p1  ORF type:complete len:1109 (+),score=196.70 GHVP01014708.1:2346-5672(+)
MTSLFRNISYDSLSNKTSQESTAPLVFSFGSNSHGQLMLKDSSKLSYTSTPTLIPRFINFRVSFISCGDQTSYVVTESGALWSSGDNEFGISNPSCPSQNNSTPYRFEDTIDNVKYVASSRYHGIAILDNGCGLGFGVNEFGQLGLGESAVSLTPNRPRRFQLSFNRMVSQVSCGLYHTLLVTSEGAVYSAGNPSGGCLGNGESQECSFTFKQVKKFLSFPILQVASGDEHCMALSVGGSVYTWGRNVDGVLGLGDSNKMKIVWEPEIVSLNFLCRWISAGSMHSAIVGSDSLFTCGSNGYSQLGLDSSECLSRNYFESVTIQEKVKQVSCGSNHTLVLTYLGHLFSFGKNSEGQCGVPLTENSEKGIPVTQIALPNLKEALVFYAIDAGENHSLALAIILKNSLSSGSSVQSGLSIPRTGSEVRKNKSFLEIPTANGWSKIGFEEARYVGRTVKDIPQEENNWRRLEEFLNETFGSEYILNCSFLLPGKKTVLNSDELLESYVKMMNGKNSAETKDLLCKNILRVIARVSIDAKFYTVKDQLRFIIVYLICPLGMNPSSAAALVKICTFFQALHTEGKYSIGLLMMDLCAPALRSLIRNLVAFVEHELKSHSTELRSQHHLWNAMHMLQIASDVNDLAKESSQDRLRSLKLTESQDDAWLTYDEFHIPTVQVDLAQEMQFAFRKRIHEHLTKLQNSRWFNPSSSQSLRPFCEEDQSLISHFNLMPLVIKKSFMKLECQAIQTRIGFNSLQHASMPFFVITVRREYLLEDTIGHLFQASNQDILKPLKIRFYNEDVVDEGGPKREYFNLLSHRLFDVQYGMFSESPESRVMWFNRDSFEDKSLFMVAGTLLGLSLYNDVLLNLKFPKTVYKKLLGTHPLNTSDVCEVFPETARSLAAILEFEASDLFMEAFDSITFSVTHDRFGEKIITELKQDGSNIQLTLDNREEFVRLYADHLLETSIKNQFEPFKEGFRKFWSPAMTRQLLPEELKVLICGEEIFDFVQMKELAKYEGYFATEKYICDFWDVVLSFSEREKRQFLKFWTGYDLVPVGGFESVGLKIQNNGTDDQRLPSSYTCFYVLLLPRYSSKEILSNKLRRAIQEHEGFGLM